MKQEIKAKGHYMYEYISKVKGQGRQYRHTADLDLGPGSGLRKSLYQRRNSTTRGQDCPHTMYTPEP